METSIVAFILLWSLLIIVSLRFALNVRDNHPNNKIHGGKNVK